VTPQLLGAHNPRLVATRELLRSKIRRERGRFLLEGPTLLAEASAAGIPLEAVFSTAHAFEQYSILREVEARGVPVFLTDERSIRKLSDVASPAGVIAIGEARLTPLDRLFSEPGIVLVLADLSDPGNAGTLARAADAFGVSGVVFGMAGVEPYHPKVVRAAMGSLFRLQVARADPDSLATAVHGSGWTIAGLSPAGEPIATATLPDRLVLVVGQERRGLGPWGEKCERLLSIPMRGSAESLNAAVAGAIAIYEAGRGRR